MLFQVLIVLLATFSVLEIVQGASFSSFDLTSHGFLAAASRSKGIFLSKNHGSTWVESLAPKIPFSDVSMSSAGNVVVGIASKHGMYVSNDHGIEWKKATVNGNHDWKAVRVSASGRILFACSENSLFRSRDFGTTWEEVLDVPGNWQAISMDSTGQYGIIVGLEEGVYISSDFGKTWAPSAGIAPGSWVDISCDPQGHVWTLAGLSEGIYTSTDFGQTWKKSNAPVVNWRSITSDASGQYQIAAAPGTPLYLSKDFGSTWSKSNSPAKDWIKVHSHDDGKIIVGTVEQEEKIYTSNDRGLTWESSPVQLETSVESLSPKDMLRAFFSADGKLAAAQFGNGAAEAQNNNNARDALFSVLLEEVPTSQPTSQPTAQPTAAPTGGVLSAIPTYSPTFAPSTVTPTFAPSTAVPSIAPSAGPTVTPSTAPSATPTAAPTDAPTAAPTFAPTRAPSALPSATPTAIPTAIPTASPSRIPTAAPTTRVPTPLPTWRPSASPTTAGVPTALPTKQVTPTLQVFADYNLNNVTSSTLSSSSLTAIQLSVAYSLNVNQDTVSITGYTTTSNRRRLSISTLAATKWYSFKVNTKIVYDLVNYPGMNASSLAASVNSQIEESISSGSLTTLINLYSLQVGATELFNCTAASVTVTTDVVGPPNGDDDNGLSGGEIAAIVICSFIGFVAIVALIFYYVRVSKGSDGYFTVSPQKRVFASPYGGRGTALSYSEKQEAIAL